MPPPQHTWTSEAVRAEKGFSAITSFFQRPPKRGRPAGSVNRKRGPRPNAVDVEAATQQAAPAVEPASALPPAPATAAEPVLTRINYSSGEPLERLTKAVHDWDNKTGTYCEEQNMRLKRFAQLVGIPLKTFASYVREDKATRRVLGRGVGSSGKALVSDDSAQFVVDVMRRRDRGDEAMSRRQGIDMLQDVCPKLSMQQAQNQFDRRVCRIHSEVLTGIRKAEATTSKRSAITVEQQFRWHKVLYPSAPLQKGADE